MDNLQLYEIIKGDLLNYHWMVKEIQRLERKIEYAEIMANDPHLSEFERLHANAAIQQTDRWKKSLIGLKLKVLRIDLVVERVKMDPTDALILKYIMDGERSKDIYRFVNLSRTAGNDRRKRVIKKLAAFISKKEKGVV